jgi:hypothetical protein
MFISDLKYGIQGEKDVIELICKGKEKPIVEHNFTKRNSDWDFIIDGVSYEVKRDRMANKTGNIAVEVMCGGKLSGLSTSKADYWIFNLDKMDKIIIINKEDLFLLIKDKKKIKGGDKWKVTLYILPIKDIPEKFIYSRDDIITL